MPISPQNRKRYPPNWKKISQSIREKANNQCEFCGLENGAVGWWIAGEWHYADDYLATQEGRANFYIITGRTKVVLTVAHLDHEPENCEPSNLKALCQRCHNVYDQPHRKANAKATREAKKHAGQANLF